jgi:HSP20 family protein
MLTIRTKPVDYFNNLDILFENLLNNPLKSKGVINYYLKEDEKSIFIEMAIPGTNKKDILLTYNDGYLNIKNQPKEKEISIWNQTFNETIKIGKNIDSKKINAKFQNGIMYITIPRKAHKIINRVIEIN